MVTSQIIAKRDLQGAWNLVTALVQTDDVLWTCCQDKGNFMDYITKFLLFFIVLLRTQDGFGQDVTNSIPLKLEDAFKLAMTNSYQLKVRGSETRQSRQQVVIAQSGKLPEIGTDLTYGYLSNSDIWDPSFSNHRVA